MKKLMTERDAAVIKRLLDRGFKQHEAAALVGQNGGRANEVATGQRFESIEAASDLEVAEFVSRVLQEYADRVGL